MRSSPIKFLDSGVSSLRGAPDSKYLVSLAFLLAMRGKCFSVGKSDRRFVEIAQLLASQKSQSKQSHCLTFCKTIVPNSCGQSTCFVDDTVVTLV